MSHIRLENVSKVFDANASEAAKVLKLLQQGMSSGEVREQTGYSVGLYDINLSVEAGELHCIMGLSGSGKSTLIRHINRLIDPTQGKIWIDTQHSVGTPDYLDSAERLSDQSRVINVLSLRDKPLQKFRQNNVSMVFQHFGLVPHMTVIQNVAY